MGFRSGVGCQLIADLIERGEPVLRRIGGELNLGSLELPIQSYTFPVQGEHLTKRCPGVRRRSTGVQEPFVQTYRLAFKAGHDRPKTFIVQVAPERRSVKTFCQGGHIYDLPLQRVKLV